MIPTLPPGSWGLGQRTAGATPPARGPPNLPTGNWSGQQQFEQLQPTQPTDAHPQPHRPDSSEHGQHDHLDGESESPAGEGQANGGQQRKKSKRPRQVLSCTMCVRRKTKCDKIQPCTACVKRGDPSGCVIETGDEPPSKQPFALNSEFVALRDKVRALEDLVQDLAAALNQARSGSALPQARATQQIGSNGNSGPSRFGLPAPNGGSDDEESVAAVLQQLREGSPTLAGRGGPHSFESELGALMAQLPSRKMCDTLIASFFSRVDWQIHVLHTPLFYEEYNEFWANLQGFSQQGSPAGWLATLLVVLALGLRYSPSSSSAYQNEERLALAAQWIAAAEKALVLSDWSGRPQARSVQVVVLLAHYWHSVGEIDRLVVWVGAGVRIAQALGLQSSDKTPLNFDTDHFKVPPSSRAFFCRELGTKLWWGLCWLDWDVAYRCRNVSVLRLQDFSTATPLNVSDEEMVNGPVQARPLSSPTVSTAIALFADFLSVQHAWPIPRGKLVRRGMTTEAVLSLDRLFRDVTSRFPAYLEMSKAQESATKMIDAAKPYIQLQRLNLNKEVNARFVRLHRNAIYSDDFVSQDVAQSRAYLREAAQDLLSIIAEFRQCTDFSDMLWWMSSYAILSASLLIINLLYLRSKAFAEEQSDLPERLRAALEHLKKATSNHAKEGTRIVELLMEEYDAGRSGEGLGLHPGGQPEPKPRMWSRWKEVVDLIANATMCAAEPEVGHLRKLKTELEQDRHKWETDQTLAGLQPPQSLVPALPPPPPTQSPLNNDSRQVHGSLPPNLPQLSAGAVQQQQGFAYPPGAGFVTHFDGTSQGQMGQHAYANMPLDPTAPISPSIAERTLDNFFRELGFMGTSAAGMTGLAEWPQEAQAAVANAGAVQPQPQAQGRNGWVEQQQQGRLDPAWSWSGPPGSLRGLVDR